jgi:hypothetical protein
VLELQVKELLVVVLIALLLMIPMLAVAAVVKPMLVTQEMDLAKAETVAMALTTLLTSQ